MDVMTPAQRSKNMAAIKSKDTKPEISVRKLLHSRGLRFRLHRKDLPGNPDIVLPKYKTAIFVHGCFWHQHHSCKLASKPKSRVAYWKEKLDRNTSRDQEHKKTLENLGWRVIIIWECETRSKEDLKKIVAEHIHTILEKTDSASTGVKRR